MRVQDVILRAMAKHITWRQAAEIIEISDRSMRLWKQRYESHPPELLPTTSLHPTRQPPPVLTRPQSGAQLPSSRRSCLLPASRPPSTV
jgi:hypothetical protein